jgi:hypothetical protein
MEKVVQEIQDVMLKLNADIDFIKNEHKLYTFLFFNNAHNLQFLIRIQSYQLFLFVECL